MARINFDANIPKISPATTEGPAPATKGTPGQGQKFSQVLKSSLAEVNRLQVDAEQATNALATGRTDNVAEVMTAVNKAEVAFQMLLQIRNKLLDAYTEVRQMRL